jgi:transposase InsO family protein
MPYQEFPKIREWIWHETPSRGSPCLLLHFTVERYNRGNSFASGRGAILSFPSGMLRRGPVFARRLRAMGIRDRPIAPGSPWQNAYVERLIGTIRRECLDHMIVFGEAQLSWYQRLAPCD